MKKEECKVSVNNGQVNEWTNSYNSILFVFPINHIPTQTNTIYFLVAVNGSEVQPEHNVTAIQMII